MDRIRVYAKINDVEYGLLQVADYYNEAFRYELLQGQQATVFPNELIAKDAVTEFKRTHPATNDIEFNFVTVLNYKS